MCLLIDVEQTPMTERLQKKESKKGLSKRTMARSVTINIIPLMGRGCKHFAPNSNYMHLGA